MKYFIIFSLMLTIFESFAQTTKKTLVVPNFKSKELSAKENSIIKGLIARVSAEQVKYQLLFKNDNLALTQRYDQLDLNFSSLERNKKVSASLIDLKTSKTIKFFNVEIKNRNNLIIKTEFLLRKIFNLEDTERFKEIIKKFPELIPPQKLLKAPTQQRPYREKIAPPRETVDFRQRILNIKQDLPSKLEESKVSIEEEKTAKKASEKPAQKPNINETNRDTLNKDPKKKINPDKIITNYDFSVKYFVNQYLLVDSRVLVEDVILRNDSQQLAIGGRAHLTNIKSFVSNLHLELFYLYFSTIDELEFDNYLEGSIDTIYQLYEDLDLQLGLSKDSMIFGSLPVRGENIQPSKLDIFYLKVMPRYEISSLNTTIFLESALLLFSLNDSEHEIDTSNASYAHFKVGAETKITIWGFKLMPEGHYKFKQYSNSKDIEIEGHSFEGSITYLF